MASEAADSPQTVNEKIEAEDGKLIKETTNIKLDKILKEERMDAEDTPYEPHEALEGNFEVESVKNTNEGSAEAGEDENFFNLPSIAKDSVEANNSSPDACEVIEKPDQTKEDAWKIQSLEDEKLDNRLVEIIATKETSEEIQQNVEKLSSSLDKVADKGVIPVDSIVESADATSEQKVEDSTHAPDTKDARVDNKKLKDTSIGETSAEKFGSGEDGKLADNYDVALEKRSQETITLREYVIDVTKDECQLQDQNNSECSFLKDAEDVVIQEGNKTATVQEVSEMVLESILNQSAGEVENQSTNLEEVGDRSIQTATQKTEEISLKQVDEPQIKHDERLLKESGKLSSTEDPAWKVNHEGIGAGDLKKDDVSEDERSSEIYLPYEKPVESLHVASEEIRTSASCQNAEAINLSQEQIHINPEEILSDETKDNTIDAADTKDVATIDPNEEAGGSIPYCSTTDLNVTHPLEERNENDGPSIDTHHDPVTNSNTCSKEGCDQINNLEDQDHSEALLEVREDQSKETGSQVNDDRQVTSKPDDTETQMMDKEQDTTIQSEATADETIKICKEKTELEVTHSSENIEKIILLNENRNQHVPIASNLEEKVAESLEGDKNITDILSQEVKYSKEMEDSYQVHDVCMDNSTKIINADSGAKDNFTVSTDEKTETGVSCEKQNEIEKPDTEILEQRFQSQDTDKQIMMETDGFKDKCTETLEENSAKEISQEDKESKEIVEAELSTREVLNVVNPSSAITENKLDENLNKDERNVIISEQEIKNAEKEGMGENFKGTHFSEDNKAETLEHEEESSTNCIIQRSIQSEEQEIWPKDNKSSVSEISEGSRDDIIVTPELAVTVGIEDPNLEEVKLQDKLQLDENDQASEKLGMPTSKPDKKDAESIDIKSEHGSISNLGENRDVNLLMTGGNEADETDTGEITKYEVQNETQAALSKCNDQVAAGGNVSHNTLEMNLGESYNPSYEEQNFLPVSGNESKNDNSENIEGSSIIPNSSSAEKTTENIDTEKDVVGQDTARNSDNFLKETVDNQKPALESKTEDENRMEYLDINSMNSMTEKDLESVEPTKEPPSTLELVIELQGEKSNPENTIIAVVDDGIKAIEEKNELIGEILISQHSLDGKVETDDDGREHEPDGKQHIDLIQGVEKDHESDNTTEQEEKVIEQDFESRQREASCEKEIQLGADNPNDRSPNCNQIITDGSLSEEVQGGNENADSGGKINEQIEEEGCLEDVQMISASDDDKEIFSLNTAEDLSQEQEEISVTEVPEDEKLANMTSLASVTTEENTDYKIIHEPSSFHDKNDTEDVHVIDDAITISSKENLVQVDPEESTDLSFPCGEKVETMQQDTITVLEKIEEPPRNASEAVSKGKITLDIAEDLNQKQEESPVTKMPEDEKLANMTSLASVATEENSDYKIDHEPSSFHDKTDTEDVQVPEDSIAFSLKENLVQVDLKESPEHQVPCGEILESIQQDPITVLEEIEEKQLRNASDAISEEKGVNFEGAKRTTNNCEDVTDSSSFVELDEISPSNPPQESRKETVQMGEDKGTEKQEDDLHTLAHTKDSPMEITQKDAPWCVASTDGSEDTGVMEKFVAATLPASDENMVEEAKFKESEFADNSTSNKNIQQLQQEDTSETFLIDVKNMKPAEGELEEANCVQEKIIAGETIESRKESTSVEIAKGSPPDILQIYSMETSHTEDHSTKEKELTIDREELHVEKTEPIQDKGEKLQEDKEEEEEAGNPKMCTVDVAIHGEKGQGSSTIKNLAQTNLDDSKEKITQDISDGEQAELSVTKMSVDENLPNTISLAFKATEENSESNTFHEKTDTQDVQVLEDSIKCSYKEDTVQGDPKEGIDRVPSGEKVELLQQDSLTVLEEIEEQQIGNAFDTVSEAKGVNSEGEKGISDRCEEIVASSSFVAMDEISHSNPLPESSTETMQEVEEKETVNQHEGIHILAQTMDSPMEITQKDAPLCIASSDDNQVIQELEVASLPALDKNVVDEASNEETTHVEDHSTKDKELTINKEELHAEKTEPIEDKGAKMQEEKEEEEEAGKLKRSDFGSQALTLVEERGMDVTGSVSEAPDENLKFKVEGEVNKFNDEADTTPSTVMKKETSVGEICDNEKCTNSHDETPEIVNTTSDDIEHQEVESERVAEDAASVPQSETVEAQHADTGSAVVKKSESNEVEFADEENKAGEVYKSNDQNVEELKSREFPTLTKNNAENSEKETEIDYQKGSETKCERAVIEDDITCDQVKQELQEKSLELLSKVQSRDNKLQSTENNDHGENEESREHRDKPLKDEDSLNNSTKKDEVDNLVDSNLEILQPDKLEEVIGSETQVQSFEVITKGRMKSEEENLVAAKEEIRAGKIVAEEIFEANEIEKIDMPSEKIKDGDGDGDEAVVDCQLGSPAEATFPERCQEGEEKPEEDPKVKTEEAIKCADEKVSGNFEEAYINENVSEHIVFDKKAVEEPKESIDEILHVKEEGNVETEREVKSSEVAFLEHGEDRTGANEDTGLQNRNINFSPMGDTAAGKPQDNENIKSEVAPTKLIYETIETCEDNKEIFTREKAGTERKDEKLTISESLGDEESDERQDRNQHQFKIDKQLKYEVCISNRVQEKDEEQVMLSAGGGEVVVGAADTYSRQTEDENEKPDLSSHSKDTSEISHSDGVLGIAKDNENSTNIRMLEKIFNGTTKSEISEATCPNESGEAITSAVSKHIQPMEHDSEAITVDAEMHESKARTASSDVETMGVQYGEERKENDDYKEMTETSTSMECAISTSKIMHGSAEVMSVAVDDQETQDQFVKLQHLLHLPQIQASEMGKTEEVGSVDLQRASNITGDMQELDERSIALSNKENLAEIDPNESKEQKDSSCEKEFDIIQQDQVPATLRQVIEKQQPKNSSEAVSDAKDEICEEEKVTVDNCNEFIENNNHAAYGKVTPSNMLQGSSSDAAQGSKDENTPTQHNELPILSDFKYSDVERAQTDVELCVERLDSIDVTKVAQNLDSVPVHASDKQILTDADLTKNVDAFDSTVEYKNIPQLQQDTTEIFQAEGEIQKPSGVEQEEAKCGQEERTTDETSESTNKSASTEIAKPLLSDHLQGSLKESSEMADHHTEGRKSAVQKEELKAGKTEEAKHEEEKYSHEESNEQKISDLGSGAPVRYSDLDAADMDAKVAHKKSHNILSGVGSKMKHSIAKVKKAITGKSSHPKPPPPKESEEC